MQVVNDISYLMIAFKIVLFEETRKLRVTVEHCKTNNFSYEADVEVSLLPITSDQHQEKQICKIKEVVTFNVSKYNN